MKIEKLSAATGAARLDELTALLLDSVAHGASIGFLAAITRGEAAAYWRSILEELPGGARLLLGAFDASGRLTGAVQLALATRPNSRHRAEVQKLLVFGAARRRGVGASLMTRLEAEALARGRTLLLLDTSVGAAGAEKFYERSGYLRAGGFPDYAANPDGTLVPNVFFYKRLA